MAAKLSNAVLLEMLSSENDKNVLLKLLEGRRVADKKLAMEVAKLFVSRVAAGVSIDPAAAGDSIDASAKALEMLGLSENGINYLSPQDTEFYAKDLLPVVFGESEEAPVFHSDINAAMLDYLIKPAESGFSPEIKTALDKYLTNKRVEVLLARVQNGQLPVEATSQELHALAERHNVEIKSKIVVPPGVARLGTGVSFPDAASIADKAELEAQRYALEVDAKTDALISLNALMAQKGNWVHRQLVDKLKDKIADAVKGNGYRYPSESLFSETLSEIDDNGRVVNEMVRFSRPPLRGFKASFKSPRVPNEAYLATGLRLRSEGVKFPYIKANFKNPEEAKIFLEKSLFGLTEAGYALDDITVSPNLKNFFLAYKAKEAESFTIESTPTVPIEPTRGEEVVLKDELHRLQSSPELAEALGLYEQLVSINKPLTFMLSKINDPERPMKLKDFADGQLISVLSKYPLVNSSSETWNTALKAAGLVPSTRALVNDVGEMFERYIEKADPAGGSKTALGTREKVRLLAARDVLFQVMPDKAAQLVRVFDALDGKPKVEFEQQAPQGNEAQHPSQQPDQVKGVQSQTRPLVEEIAQPLNPASDLGVANPASTDAQMTDFSPDEPHNDQADYLGMPQYDYYEGPPSGFDYDPALTSAAPHSATGFPVNDYDSSAYGDYIAGQQDFSMPENVQSMPQQDFSMPENAQSMPQQDSGVRTPNAHEMPEDVVRPAYVFSKDTWGDLLGKSVHELPAKIFDNIAGLTPADELHIQVLSNADGWSELELAEAKNTIEGLCRVSNKHLTSIADFSDREKEFFSALPDGMVPDSLRAEHAQLKEMFAPMVNESSALGNQFNANEPSAAGPSMLLDIDSISERASPDVDPDLWSELDIATNKMQESSLEQEQSMVQSPEPTREIKPETKPALATPASTYRPKM